MNATLIVEDFISLLQRRCGKSHQLGKARILTFGQSFTCSLNYSKLLNGHKYFFALPEQIIDPTKEFGPMKSGEFVVLICGSADRALWLPRSLMIQMMKGVSTRRVDVFVEDGDFILQTTKHPKVNVSSFLNAWPDTSKSAPSVTEESVPSTKDRIHVKVQWGLISLGRAEDCSIWVDRKSTRLNSSH